MKKFLFSLLSLSLLTMAACQKDDAPETNATRILGKWKIEKIIDEYYHPVNVLIDRQETTPDHPEDYIEFKADGKVYMYSPTEGDDFTTYEFKDETHIEIEDEVYEIKSLTETSLHLFQDVTENNDTRFVQNAYFKRF